MSSPESNALHIVHVFCVIMLVGFTFYACAADAAKRKSTLALSGVAALLVLLTGLRMWQAEFNFAIAGWIFVKIACWLVIAALGGMAFRRRERAGLFLTLTLVAAAIAVAMVYLKPF